MNRETVYAALFTRLQEALPTWCATRDLVPIDQVQRLPAFVQTATGGHVLHDDAVNVPATHRLDAIVALYMARTSPASPFETEIHAAIDAVVDSLAAQPGEAAYGDSAHTNLGGLVERAWVQGNIEIHREPSDARAIILIPVEAWLV